MKVLTKRHSPEVRRQKGPFHLCTRRLLVAQQAQRQYHPHEKAIIGVSY